MPVAATSLSSLKFKETPLTAENALPVHMLPPGIHTLHIACDRRTFCVPRPHSLIRFGKPESPFLDHTTSLSEQACGSGGLCLTMTGPEERPRVNVIDISVHLEHARPADRLLGQQKTRIPSVLTFSGAHVWYSLSAICAIATGAACRLSRVIKLRTRGSSWLHAMKAVYALAQTRLVTHQ